MLCEDVTKTEDAGQVLDAFQQAPEPISTFVHRETLV